MTHSLTACCEAYHRLTASRRCVAYRNYVRTVYNVTSASHYLLLLGDQVQVDQPSHRERSIYDSLQFRSSILILYKNTLLRISFTIIIRSCNEPKIQLSASFHYFHNNEWLIVDIPNPLHPSPSPSSQPQNLIIIIFNQHKYIYSILYCKSKFGSAHFDFQTIWLWTSLHQCELSITARCDRCW